MNEVIWKVLEVNENTGEVSVEFFDGVNSNIVIYRWPGNQEDFIRKMNDQAAAYKIQWAPVPVDVSQIITLTGSSEDATPSVQPNLPVLVTVL